MDSNELVCAKNEQSCYSNDKQNRVPPLAPQFMARY
jgi:hypothetical protein